MRSYHRTRWYAILVLVLLLGTYLLNQADRYAFAIGGKLMQQELGFGAVEYQLLAGPLFVAVYSVTGIGAGYLADRLRRTWYLATLLAGWSTVTFLCASTSTFWQVALLRMAQGLAEAGCTPLANGLIGDYFSKSNRGTALGVYNWGIYMGYGAAYGIGNVVTHNYGWRAMFRWFGGPGLALAVAVACLHEPKRGRLDNKYNPRTSRAESVAREELDDKARATSHNSSGSKNKGATTPATLTQVLRYWAGARSLVLLCIAGAIRNAGGYVWAYNTNRFFVDTRHQTPSQIAAFMGWIPLVGGSLGAVLGGFISDRVVKNGTHVSRVWVLVLSQVLGAPFAAGALFLPVPWAYLSLIPANVIGEMWVGVTLALVLDLVPSNMRASSVAIYFFIIANVGGNVPVLVPVLSQYLGQQYALLILYPSLYIVAAVLFMMVMCLMRADLRRAAAKESEDRLTSVGSVAELDGTEPLLPQSTFGTVGGRSLSDGAALHGSRARRNSLVVMPLLARASVDCGGIGVTPAVESEVVDTVRASFSTSEHDTNLAWALPEGTRQPTERSLSSPVMKGGDRRAALAAAEHAL